MKSALSTKAGLSVMRSAFSNENGAVLVIGLMFLAILAMLGTTAVVMTTTDMQIGANYKASVQGSYVAEAGVSEAIYRLGLFDDGGTVAPPSGSMININGLTDNNAAISIDPNNLLGNTTDDDNDGSIDEIDELNSNTSQGVIAYDNRNWQTKIMLKTSDDADTTTTFYTPTIQSSGSWLEYSSSTDDGTALTIEFKKDTGDMDNDSDTSEIVFYNESLTNPLNVDATDGTPVGDPASGQPVVVITSTGRSGGSTRKVQVGTIHQPFDIEAEGALMVNITPGLGGGLLISGFNYEGSTGPDDEKVGTPAKWLKSTDAVFPAQAAVIAAFRQNDADNYGGGNQPAIEELTICAAGTACVNFTGSPECPDLNNPNAADPCDYPPHDYCSFVDIDTALINCGWCDTDCSILDVNKEDWWELEDGVPYGQKLESSGHLPAIWSTDTGIAPGSNTDVLGGDSDGTKSWILEGAAGWPLLKDLLQVSQETLDGILAGANSTTMDGSGHLTSPLQGIIYIDNAGGGELKITASTPSYDNGWGLMYVTGDVDFAAGTYFRGLIYVEGDMTCTGSPLFVGCIAVKGDADGAFATGNPHVLYSYDALTEYANKGTKFIVLSWKDEGVS